MAQAAPIEPGQREDRIEPGHPGRAVEKRGVARLPGQRRQREQNEDAQLRLQPLGAEDAHERPRPAPPEGDEDALEDALALEAPQQRRSLRLARQPAGGERIEPRTHGQRHHAHHQRRVDPVPEPEAVFRRRRPEHRDRRHVQIRPHGRGRDDADDEAGHHQHLDRKAHPAHRLVRLARQIHRRRPEEDLVDEAQRVGDAEARGDQRPPGGDAGRGSSPCPPRRPRRRTSPSTGTR